MILVECKPDERLVKTLGVPRKKVRHENDKGRICKKLEKMNSGKGLVDEKRDNKLIVLCPRLEEWIIWVCHSNNLKMKDFGLPDNANDLHREINGKLDNFLNLLEKLLEIKAPQVRFLKSHI